MNIIEQYSSEEDDSGPKPVDLDRALKGDTPLESMANILHTLLGQEGVVQGVGKTVPIALKQFDALGMDVFVSKTAAFASYLCTDEASDCEWETVLLWLECIDTLLSTLSSVANTTHAQHTAQACKLCAHLLKEYAGQLDDLTKHCSENDAGVAAELREHVTELIPEVRRAPNPTPSPNPN